MQRFRGGLVFKAHKLCVSLNPRLESNTEEEEETKHCSDTLKQGGEKADAMAEDAAEKPVTPKP